MTKKAKRAAHKRMRDLQQAESADGGQALRIPSVRLFTVPEFSDITRWKRKTIYQKIWLGELEYVRCGARSIRIPENVLEGLMVTVPKRNK
jgi:hypothetical protein